MITGLDAFGVRVSSLSRMGSRRTVAQVHLASYDVTAQVRRLHPAKRHAYLARRVDGWISCLQERFPHLSIEATPAPPPDRRRRWDGLPTLLKVRAPARDLRALARSPGVPPGPVRRLAGWREQRRAAGTRTWLWVRRPAAVRLAR